jgi:subtilisin family serine protease
MDPTSQIRLSPIMNISSGNPHIKIGLIDGPIELNHPAFQGSRIRAIKVSQIAACKNASSLACRHGTFIAGILSAKRGSPAAAICPGCTLLLRPVFIDETLGTNNKGINSDIIFPSTTPEELSDSIIEVVDAGAHVINLSLSLSTSSLMKYPILQEAYDYARHRHTIIVAAAGNQGNLGASSLINNHWVIPVAACDEKGVLDPISNFGQSVGIRGLMAPGINLTSTSSGGGYLQMSGTSLAAPFVTGAIALLWSIFPKARAADIIQAIRPVASSYGHNKSIIPPLVNIESAYQTIRKFLGQ